MSERGLALYQQAEEDGTLAPQTWASEGVGEALNVVRRFLPMSKERRDVMQSIIDSVWHKEVHIGYVNQILHEAHEFSKESLRRVGLTPETYLEAISAMVSNNRLRLSYLTWKSERLMGRKKSRNIFTESAFQPIYAPKKMEEHQTLINRYLNEVEPSETPKIIVLVGPPGCGKTEVFNQDEDCQPGKAVNIDIDEIRKKLKPNFNPKNQQEVEEFREEAWRFADNLMAQCVATKRSFVLQTPLHRKHFWLDNQLLHDAIDKKQFSVRVKVIMRDVHDSFRRAMLRGMPMDANSDVEGRMVALGDFIEAVRGYGVVESFCREYDAELELHDYLQYSQGKTKMKSKMGAKAFNRLLWLTKGGTGIKAKKVEHTADVPIEKSRRILKKI